MSGDEIVKRREDKDGSSDSDDAPEEVTALQGFQLNEEINKAVKLTTGSARQQLKERNKKRAARLTPRSKKDAHAHSDDEMLPDEIAPDILTLRAAQENHVYFPDDDKDSLVKKPKRRKNKINIPGVETVVLKELPGAHCVQSSLDFLKKRKTQVPRSSAVLNNSHHTLRLLSSSGLLK